MGTGEDYNQNIISRHRSGWAGQTQLEEQTVLESTVRPERESLQRLAMPRLEKTYTDLLRLTDANRSPWRRGTSLHSFSPYKGNIKSETVNDFSPRINLSSSSPCGDGHSAPLTSRIAWNCHKEGFLKSKTTLQIYTRGSWNSEPNWPVHCYPQPDTRNWRGHTTCAAQTHCSQVGDIQKSRPLKNSFWVGSFNHNSF